MAKLYTLSAVEKLAEKYHAKGGQVVIVKEGVLLDDMVMLGEGLKTAIIKSVFLNEWSSAYSVRFYNRLPKKYESII